jgi:hypothetical protein
MLARLLTSFARGSSRTASWALPPSNKRLKLPARVD